jgi:hypothetical protein
MDELYQLQQERRRAERIVSGVLAKGQAAARALGRGDGSRYFWDLLKALPKDESNEPGLVAVTRAEVAKDKRRPDLVQVLNKQIDEHMAKGEFHQVRVLESMRNRVNP